MHGEQGSDSLETGAVTNGGGHRHHGAGCQPSDDAGESTFHPSDHDHCISCGDPVDVGE